MVSDEAVVVASMSVVFYWTQRLGNVVGYIYRTEKETGSLEYGEMR